MAKKSKPNILFYDTETSPMILASFGLFDQNHSYTDVYQDWFMICAQWSWNDSSKVEVASVLDDMKAFKLDHTNDYHVIKNLHDQISNADIIVAHNGDRFDWRKFMAKVIEHRLPPIRKPYMVDTLKAARKFGFSSNKLADLNTKLGIVNKLDHQKGLWPKAAMGDEEAIRAIIKYGKGDIPALRQLYKVMLPYMDNHPNLNNFFDGDCCPNCGSKHFQKRGVESAKVNSYQRYCCMDCGKWFRGKQVISKVNMR